MADVEIEKVRFCDYFLSPDVGMVHEGFCRLLAKSWDTIQETVTDFQGKDKSLWITGHSLGGALAKMSTAAFIFAAQRPVNGLYTFGQPRVGDIFFCNQCESSFGDAMFRYVNDEDIVPRVPPRIVPGKPLPSFYNHSGQLRYFDAKGNLHSDDHWWNAMLLNIEVGYNNMKALLEAPVEDHSLDRYISLIETYLNSGSPPI
jgi:triacylglycerol lipase